jgi:hypothetical protein
MTLEEALQASVTHVAHYGRLGQRGCQTIQAIDGSFLITLFATTGLRQQTYTVTSLAEARMVITLEWLIPTNLGWRPGQFFVTESCPECGAPPIKVKPEDWFDGGFCCEECGYCWS